MTIEDFKFSAKRVWIDNASSLQPYHKFHGKVGIATYKKHNTGYEEISIFFTEGEIISFSIDPKYLVDCFPVPKYKETNYKNTEEYRRMKRDQYWDLAGLARMDGDKVDEERYIKLARNN